MRTKCRRASLWARILANLILTKFSKRELEKA